MDEHKNVKKLREMLQFQSPLKKRLELGCLPGSPQITVSAGQLIEVLGEGQFSWIMQFSKEIPTARIAWVTPQDLQLFPFAIAQEQVCLSRFLFLDNVRVEEGLSRLLVIIRSSLFQILVFDQSFLTQGSSKRNYQSSNLDSQIRKLHITAEDFGVVMVMLSQKSTQSFGVSIQIETSATEEMRLLKVKGRAYAK